jgi:hypothetical protein
MNQVVGDTDQTQRIPLGLFSLIDGDRLGSTLGRFAIASPLTAALVAAATGFSAAIVTTLEGTFSNPQLSLDLYHDIGWWNQFVLAIATLIYIAGAYFGAYPGTLRQLVDAGVIQATDAEWKKVRRFTKARLHNPGTVALPYVCGGLGTLLSFYVTQTSGAWFDANRYYAGWLIPIHAFMLYYLLTFLTLRLYFAFLILKMLFAFQVNIQPFHTDGCGGLGSLKTQSGKLYLGLLIFGFIAAAGMISNTVNYGLELFDFFNLAMLIAYMTITSIAFFLPLYATSTRMREAQEKFLQSINTRYRALLHKLEDDLVTKGSNEDILALESLRTTARSMQVWPFNRTALAKFFAVVSTPLVIIGLFALTMN